MQDNNRESDQETRIRKDNDSATRIYETSRGPQTDSAASPDQKTSVVKEKQSDNTGITIGATIAQRFVLERFLGHGGMSIVYRARDLVKVHAGDPNPYVAIKILRTNLNRHLFYRWHPWNIVLLESRNQRHLCIF